MSTTKELKTAISELPEMTTYSSLTLMALTGSVLQKIPSHLLQQFVMNPRFGDKAINLDTDRVNGIFNMASSKGTKPAVYGIVFQLGIGTDWYQFAIDSNSHFYTRANTNNNIGVWRRLTRDTAWTAPVSGGGVTHYLSVNCAVYPQEGGRREHDSGTYQLHAEGETDRCDGIQKHPVRLGHTNDSRDILHGYKYRMRESSNRFGQLLEVRRRRSILPESTNHSATVLPKWMRTEVDFARWHNPSLDDTWLNSLLALGKEVAA